MFSVYIRRAEEKGKLIFPNRFASTEEEVENAEKKGIDLKSLEGLKRQKGPYEYGCQYLNDPVDDESIEFKREWFRHFDQDDETITLLKAAPCVISVDPAFKLKETHDDTGITITKPTEKGVFILEAQKAKLNADELIKRIFDLVEIYEPYKVKIETVAAQILLTDILRKEMSKRGVSFMIEEYHPGTKESKAVRIRKLIPYYANGQILHRRGLVDLEEQLIQFPRGRKDDIIDSLAAQVNDWNAKKVYKKHVIKPGTLAWWKQTIRPRTRSIEDIFNDLNRRV